MKKQFQADLALLLVTVGWGASFILTKNALEDLATYNFLGIRFLLAFILGLPLILPRLRQLQFQTIKSSFIVGAVLFTGYALQTMGLHYTTISKSAFITGFSVVLVPILSALFLKKRPEPQAAFGSLMALIGLGFLTLNDTMSLNIGDLLTLASSFAFASHILLVGHYTNHCDSLHLGVFQIGVVGSLSMLTSFFIESPSLPTSSTAWFNILFLSLFCTAGAFIIQSIAQRYTTATHTALIYSGEPVFAAIFGYLWLGEILSGRGLLGGALILVGMLTAELDVKSLISKRKAA